MNKKSKHLNVFIARAFIQLYFLINIFSVVNVLMENSVLHARKARQPVRQVKMLAQKDLNVLWSGTEAIDVCVL